MSDDGSGLTIRKFGYSSHPWRFAVNGKEFWISGQPHFSFARKRDAKPFLEKLLAIGDWTKPESFTEAQRRQVQEIATQTESYRQYVELISRPAHTYFV